MARTFREWIRSQPCVRCGVCHSDPHHVRAVGMGGNRPDEFDDENLVALCRVCHTDLHKMGREKFEYLLGHTLEDMAGVYWHLYQEFLESREDD